MQKSSILAGKSVLMYRDVELCVLPGPLETYRILWGISTRHLNERTDTKQLSWYLDRTYYRVPRQFLRSDRGRIETPTDSKSKS
jgi:hypothetical protein